MRWRDLVLGVSLGLCSLATAAAAEREPVLIALDAEFSHKTSTAPASIRAGILIAIDEINRAGGVLGGRPLALVERDNRSISARANDNLRELAKRQNLVAVLCGKFSPTVIESLATIHENKLITISPWAAADGITKNDYVPNYAFRLSLFDTIALRAMLDHAAQRGMRRVGLLVPNTAWGRSSVGAAEAYLPTSRNLSLAGTHWYNFGDKSLISQYNALREKGAEAIILVANEPEGAILVREVASLPGGARLPIISHWGVTGGNFPALTGPALGDVDFSVIQTYSFLHARRTRARQVIDAAKKHFSVSSARAIPSPVGVAHAYDIVHILARAIDLAKTTDRAAVRDALERVRNYDGLIKHYARPFAPGRHEALGAEDVFFARYDAEGTLVRIPKNAP